MKAIDDDAEILSLARRCEWEPLFEPERAKLREKELRLSHARTRIMGYPGVVRTLALLVGCEDDGDVYESEVAYKYTPGVLVSKTWNTIFVNNAKKQLESDKVCSYKN